MRQRPSAYTNADTQPTPQHQFRVHLRLAFRPTTNFSSSLRPPLGITRDLGSLGTDRSLASPTPKPLQNGHHGLQQSKGRPQAKVRSQYYVRPRRRTRRKTVAGQLPRLETHDPGNDGESKLLAYHPRRILRCPRHLQVCSGPGSQDQDANPASSEAFKGSFRVAKTIIVHSCSDSIKRAIDHCEHPRAMWLALEVQFHTSQEAIDRRRTINHQFKLSKPTAGIPISEWLRHLLLLQKLVMFSDMMILNDAVIRHITEKLPPGPSLDILRTMKKAGDTPKRIIEAIRDREYKAGNVRTRSAELKPWCSYHQQSDDHTNRECPVLNGRPWVKLKKPGDGFRPERSRRASTGSPSTRSLSNDASVKLNEGPKRQQSRAAISQGCLDIKATQRMSSTPRNSWADTSSKASRHPNDGYATKPYNPAGLWNTADNPRFNLKAQAKPPETRQKSSTSAADQAFSPITPPPPKGYWGHHPRPQDPFPPSPVRPTQGWNKEAIVHRAGGSDKDRHTRNKLPPKRGGTLGPWNSRGKFPNPAPVRRPTAAASPVAPGVVPSTARLRGDIFPAFSVPTHNLPKNGAQQQQLGIDSASCGKMTARKPINGATRNPSVLSGAEPRSKVCPDAPPGSPKVLNKDGKLVTPPHLRPVQKPTPGKRQQGPNVLKVDDDAPNEELYIGDDGYMRRRNLSASATAAAKPLARNTPSPPTPSPATSTNGGPSEEETKEPKMQLVIGRDGWMRAGPITAMTPSPIPTSSPRPQPGRADQLPSKPPPAGAATAPVVPHMPGISPERRCDLPEISIVSPPPPRQPPPVSPVAPDAGNPAQQVQSPPSSYRIRRINAFCRWYDRVRNRNDDEDAEEFAMAALSIAHHVMTREHWELEDIALFSQHDWDRYIEYHPAMMMMTRAVATYLACLARGMIDKEVEEE